MIQRSDRHSCCHEPPPLLLPPLPLPLPLLLLLLKSASARRPHSSSGTLSSWNRMYLPAFQSLLV
jgi:hypothetical protein